MTGAIVLDTSVVIALMNRSDDQHVAVREWMADNDDDLVTTPLAVAEMDHLVRRRGGPVTADALRADLRAGAYTVEWWPLGMRETVGAAERYSGMDLGLTDASLVALAARLGTSRIATLDERNFRAVLPLAGEHAFTLLPTDVG